jgi:hypothetical protein
MRHDVVWTGGTRDPGFDEDEFRVLNQSICTCLGVYGLIDSFRHDCSYWVVHDMYNTWDRTQTVYAYPPRARLGEDVLAALQAVLQKVAPLWRIHLQREPAHELSVWLHPTWRYVTRFHMKRYKVMRSLEPAEVFGIWRLE